MTSANTNLLKVALTPEHRMTIEKAVKIIEMTGGKEMTNADQAKIDQVRIIGPKERTNLPKETIHRNLKIEKVLNLEEIPPQKIEKGNQEIRVPNRKTEKKPTTMKKLSHLASKDSWGSFLGSSSIMCFFSKVFV